MFKILLIEDDRVIADNMARHLRKWDYEILVLEEFKKVLETVQRFAPQLVLLDITLPFMNGYHWCSEIRKLSNVPIMFISSASDNMNVVMAMNMGADDFIAKPFDLDVLTAKVSALLRRAYSFSADMNLLEYNGLQLNLGDMTLHYQDKRLELTKNDAKILQVLLEHAGQVVSRDSLMRKLWDSESFIDDNTLTVNMTRLRKKLEELGLVQWIKTKKGLGYMVDAHDV